MRYVFDNDLHIHSQLASCSGDSEQTVERILEYAKSNGLRTICLTDHFWDETVPSKAGDCGWFGWYAQQNTAHIRQALPLPQSEGIRFLFEGHSDGFRLCVLERRCPAEILFRK